jgi:hypothetical protein
MAPGGLLVGREMTDMTTAQLTHAERSLVAEKAWSALPHGGRDAVRLQVHCGRGHHVAAVYATDAGLVYLAPVRAHSHGAHDLPDEPHGAQRVQRWFDLLAAGDGPMVDDALPAWCDCGHRVLSRAAVLEWLGDGEHRVVID